MFHPIRDWRNTTATARSTMAQVDESAQLLREIAVRGSDVGDTLTAELTATLQQARNSAALVALGVGVLAVTAIAAVLLTTAVLIYTVDR